MSTIILNDETAKTPLGDVLRTVSEGETRITDPTGRLIARLTLVHEPTLRRLSVEEIERDVEELRRRASSDRSGDVTTADLLARLRQHGSEDAP